MTSAYSDKRKETFNQNVFNASPMNMEVRAKSYVNNNSIKGQSCNAANDPKKILMANNGTNLYRSSTSMETNRLTRNMYINGPYENQNRADESKNLISLIHDRTGWVPKTLANNINVIGHNNESACGVQPNLALNTEFNGEINEARKFKNFYFIYRHKRGKYINVYNKQLGLREES